MARVAGGAGGHKWVGGRREIGGRIAVETYPAGDEDDAPSDWGNVEIVTTRRLSARKRSSWLNSDLSPEEEDEDEILLSDFDCGTTKRDIGALARAARAKSRHVAKSNQLVPWAYTGLAVEEIARLLAATRSALQSRPLPKDRVKTHHDELEILLLIHVMLWTGSTVERAADIRVCAEHGMFDKTNLGMVLPLDGRIDKLRWRIKALTPEYKTDLEGEKEQIRPSNSAFDLPDLVGLQQFVRCHLESFGPVKVGSPLFKTPPKELKSRLEQWLKNHSPDGRVTKTKLAGTLWSRIHADMGDPALASCVTGELHPLARVRLFYSSPSISVLRLCYSEAVTKLVGLTYGALEKPVRPAPTWLLPTDDKKSVGARLCPTVDAVRKLFEYLRSDIAATSDYVDRPGFIRYHNLLTLYCVQYFAYVTTCRAIVTPYFPLSAIHRVRGMATLSDKDDRHKHKTRLVWIPEVLLETMAQYEEHLSAVRAQAFARSNSVLAEPCFFLDAGLQPVRVRPKTIEPRLCHYLNVRANTHRRFLRTELLERRCPSEVIDTFMGHWQQGEEPFGHYSSFSFSEHVDQLKEHLVPLLADIGLGRPLKFRWGTWP